MRRIAMQTAGILAALAAAVPSFAQTPSIISKEASPKPGKYFCYISNMVGLQTNSQTKQRYAGKINLSDGNEKFFITIEKNEQLPEDRCFSPSALDDLKKLRRGETPGKDSETYFLYRSLYFHTCEARFKLTTSGDPIPASYYAMNTHVFTDGFSQFWLTSNLSYVWNFNNSGGDHYLAEGRCEKIN
jgi:hypothetical protein